MPHQKKEKNSNGHKPFTKSHDQEASSNGERPFSIAHPCEVDDETCRCYRQKGHHMINYIQFPKWLNNNSKDKVTFIDESLYFDFRTNTRWIGSSATVYVTGFLQRFHKRFVQESERSIRVANGIDANVKALKDIALGLDVSFIIQPNDVLFVPSMGRNLNSISFLDDKNVHYHFGNEKCIIKVNEIDVGHEIRQEKLYLLLNCNHVNEINTSSSLNLCDVNIK